MNVNDKIKIKKKTKLLYCTSVIKYINLFSKDNKWIGYNWLKIEWKSVQNHLKIDKYYFVLLFVFPNNSHVYCYSCFQTIHMYTIIYVSKQLLFLLQF